MRSALFITISFIIGLGAAAARPASAQILSPGPRGNAAPVAGTDLLAAYLTLKAFKANPGGRSRPEDAAARAKASAASLHVGSIDAPAPPLPKISAAPETLRDALGNIPAAPRSRASRNFLMGLAALPLAWAGLFFSKRLAGAGRGGRRRG